LKFVHTNFLTTSILIVIILFSIFPLEYLANYNIINSDNRENTYSSQSDYELDFVDALHSSVWGTTDNFYAMTVNDNSYAVLFEEYVSQILPYYYISQIYRFDNIRTSFERAILHIHLLEAHTFGLDVYVGPSSSSTYKVGTIRTPGDIAFEISSLLLSSPFFVKLTDGDNPGNYGPYRISRMYVELIGLGNTIPIVNAGSDQTGNEGDILYFNGGFSDPDSGDTHTFHWNFGDGNSITGTLNPSHRYLDNGIFTVTLTVTDSQGGVGTDTLRVNINNLAPVVNAGVDQEIDEGQIVYFNGDFIDPGILDTYSINWDYGDGHSSSGSLSSSHIYEENGMYTARLNVIDDDAGIGTDSLIVTVNNQNPIVIAIEDQLTYEGNELSLILATFYNPGIYDTHTALIDWGDGTVNEGIIKETAPDDSGTVSGTHIYFNDGIYTVLITVVDDDGGIGTDSLVITVENVPPLVDAGLDQNVDEGEVVNFNGNIINLSPSEIYNIEWDFGDGDFAYETLTPTHTYDDNGIYMVTLTVIDEKEEIGTDTLIITVNNIAPFVDAGETQTVIEGENVFFSGSFNDPGVLDTHTIEWNFGDGFIVLGSLNPSHVYEDNGIYTAILTIMDNDGGVSSDDVIIEVKNANPIVDAGEDQKVDEGELVSFIGSYSDPGSLDTHSIEWDFGDGEFAYGTLTPTHVYSDNGLFIVTLNILDNDGGLGFDNVIIEVDNVAPSVDAGEDLTCNEGDNLVFIGSYTDPGILDSHSIEWDFGDGEFAYGSLTPNHIYKDNGIYTITLTVSDGDGGIGIDYLTVIVNNVAPKVISGDDQIINEGDIVNFEGDFSDPGILDTHTIEWNFGDGDFAYGTLTPTHTYNDNGIYSVTLTITDNDGGFDSDSLSISVENIAPMVNAGENINMDEGESTDFHGSFSDPGILDTHNIEWNFGDGHFSYGVLNPSHTYFDNGVYTAILTVTDDDGGKNSDSLLVNVNNVNPSLNVIEDQSILEGNSCTFDLLSFTDAGILDTHSSIIDWGDGAIDTGIITKSDQSWIVTGTHVYGDNGIYSVLISVNDDDGGISSDTLIIEVINVAPVASIVSVGQFEHSYLGTCILIDELINISGKGYDPGSDDLSFKWDFGDTTGLIINTYFNTEGIFPVEIVESITHNYFEPGYYIITLSVEDDDGGIGVDTISISILNPRALKLSAIKDLESIKTGNRCIDKKIEHVIKFIEKSLTDKYWVDDSHLNPKCGLLVFVYEIIAIKWMTNFPVMEIFAGVIQKLITADQLLADIAIAEAEKMEVKEYKFQCIYEFYIKKAKEHQSNALEAYNDGFLVCSASHYLMAWKYAQFAIKFANKEFSCHCKC